MWHAGSSLSADVSDEELMQRYADGDEHAFEVLFPRYGLRAYSYFFKRTRSQTRAEDLRQELFYRIHRSRDSFDGARPFAPWLFQIASRVLIDDCRRSYRSHEIGTEETECYQDRAVDVETLMAEMEAAEQAISRLTPEEQYVLVSTKIEGVGYAQLAAEIGKSAAAVRKLASRAMQRLRSMTLPQPTTASLGAESDHHAH